MIRFNRQPVSGSSNRRLNEKQALLEFQKGLCFYTLASSAYVQS